MLAGGGVPQPRGLVPRLRKAFLDRIDDYARTLPWTLKMLLLRRTDETDDVQLRLAIIDGFLKADPNDVDFQIARAETPLRLARPDEASQQLERAEAQWTSDVATAIQKPTPAEAVAFLFAKDYGLNSLMVLHWRYQQIELLRLITRLQQAHGAPIDIESALSDLQDKYVVGSVLIDFFPYLIARPIWMITKASRNSLSRVSAGSQTRKAGEAISRTRFTSISRLGAQSMNFQRPL